MPRSNATWPWISRIGPALTPRVTSSPRLAACATVAAIRAALQFWLDNQESASYSALLQRAIAEVAAGLPVPPGK